MNFYKKIALLILLIGTETLYPIPGLVLLMRNKEEQVFQKAYNLLKANIDSLNTHLEKNIKNIVTAHEAALMLATISAHICILLAFSKNVDPIEDKIF